jgi:hypothetical protein
VDKMMLLSSSSVCRRACSMHSRSKRRTMGVSPALAFAIRSRASLSFWWARDGGGGEEEEAEEQVDGERWLGEGGTRGEEEEELEGERGRFLLPLGDAVAVVVRDMAQWLLAASEVQDRLGEVQWRRLTVPLAAPRLRRGSVALSRCVW